MGYFPWIHMISLGYCKKNVTPLLTHCSFSCTNPLTWYINGILPKGPYPPCLHMANRALLAGYPRYLTFIFRDPLLMWLFGNTLSLLWHDESHSYCHIISEYLYRPWEYTYHIVYYIMGDGDWVKSFNNDLEIYIVLCYIKHDEFIRIFLEGKQNF